MRFSLVMYFAGRMFERKILTVGEYADFSVKTAQHFGIKMLQNPYDSARCYPVKPTAE